MTSTLVPLLVATGPLHSLKKLRSEGSSFWKRKSFAGYDITRTLEPQSSPFPSQIPLKDASSLKLLQCSKNEDTKDSYDKDHGQVSVTDSVTGEKHPQKGSNHPSATTKDNKGEYSDIQSPTDLVSPVPIDIYQVNSGVADKVMIKVSHLVEELAESEKTYYSLLELLLKYYIIPLKNDMRRPCSVSFKVMSSIIHELVQSHRKFFENMMMELYRHKGTFLLLNILKYLRELFDNYYLYVDYCTLFQGVLDLYQSTTDRKASKLSRIWLTGLGHYLEATQPSTKKHDLSFMSLIQRPTARYGKYRLFLEAIAKQVQSDRSSSPYNEVMMTMHIVKDKLFQIDHRSSNTRDIENAKYVNELLDLGSLGISSNFFGPVQLIGSLWGIWIEGDKIKWTSFMAFVFKSHLVLTDPHTTKRKQHTPKFVIPLSKCSITHDIIDWNGGMITRYQWSFKLIFEKYLCQYEILFAVISKHEFEIWKHQFETLINFVNGPYPMDYSMSNDSDDLLTVIPENLSPFNISLNLSRCKERAECYFEKPRSILIHNNMVPPQTTTTTIDEEFYYTNSDCNHFDFVINLNRYSRMKVERKLANVWSDCIPRISSEKQVKGHRNSNLFNFTKRFRSQTETNIRWSTDEQVILQYQGTEPQQSEGQGNDEIEEPMYTARTHMSGNESSKISRTSTIRSSLRQLIRSQTYSW